METAGLISFAECRLAARERPLVESFSELATPLPVYAADRPVLHTDLLQAAIAREYPVTVIAGTDWPADLQLAIERLPMRMIQRSEAKSGDDVPAGSAKVVLGDGEGRMISSAADLQDVLLPSTRK